MSTHKHDINYKKAFTVENKEGGEVIITGELPYEEVEKEREAAIKKLGANVEIDGFRKGHIPADVLEKHVGEMAILNEMAERALAHHYAHIVTEHELDVIGHPQVQITKLAKDNPFAFTLTVAVMPEVKLPDYKKLAKEANNDKASDEVTDEDVKKQIEDIMRRKLAYERLQKKAAEQEKNKNVSEATDLPTPESVSQSGGLAQEVDSHVSDDNLNSSGTEADKKEEEEFDPQTAPLPELTDDYVKELGQPGQFENVADFKEKIREHLEIEKKQEVAAAHRAKITDNIVDETKVELPRVLVDSELNQMFAQMEEDLKRANLNMEDYLKHIKKSREELIKEWTPAAEKRATLQLVLNEIAKVEDIKPDQKELEDQVAQLMEQYKDADKARVTVYVASVMQNEAVMKMLEEQK